MLQIPIVIIMTKKHICKYALCSSRPCFFPPELIYLINMFIRVMIHYYIIFAQFQDVSDSVSGRGGDNDHH